MIEILPEPQRPTRCDFCDKDIGIDEHCHELMATETETGTPHRFGCCQACFKDVICSPDVGARFSVSKE